ncbi:uncharacterized protein BDR25DRAFT_266435 [Lindgomyces ingoldianus]|uniref:Uncharacterized protein n=1 Tax=Lindgomyces ingoldianus TaxID=673940 RepID=A0ACB6QLS5_9PLEO|nr:uncharacterized protein BDR25DRAFT_266435 [Lindgomyces ingoldianus]KAF2467969.1 hypothetical protein BDR25DRAFT_266435 [Lindgomyces ingoldianus]
MTKKRANMILGGESDDQGAQVRHAPLLSGKTIEAAKTDLVPQYGFLGEKITVDTGHSDPLIFINTNTPFSAFICGVQGSGKSHTTSCILENALIRSCEIGELKSPLSALVFSFGDFNVDGAGFSISEAAFLAMPHSDFPGHPSVKKVTIMVPPSNPALARLYRRIPNVKVIPFKLKPETLGIGTLLTLMAVNQSDSTPLYMAQVTKILREIALEHEGRFDYAYFKKKIDLCDFNPTQLNMLTMRLDLLESFLDLDNSCPAPTFQPGEVTIMDMSCPFVDANTACVLFKIGLQVYLQSKAPGKMIVLDEAHKYMLEVPGAKALNDYLLAIIRLQRHYGARVIVSTQEPVLLTDLIALCSITVIHRFFSPEWFAALKKHIPMAGHDHIELMQKIEQLATGHALIYSSNAVLGQNEDGSLIKGTGKLIEVEIRSRVTSDGGQSVLCVDEV